MSLMKILCSSSWSWCLLCACLTGLPAAAGTSSPADMPESYNDEQQCAAGDAAACLSLGKSLLHADPAEPDLSLMLSYFSRACDLGAGAACPAADMLERWLRDGLYDEFKTNSPISALIEYLLAGGSVDDLKDEGAWTAFLSHTCQSGAGFSCTALGFMHLKGEGAGQDYIRARQFFERSCGLDDARGCAGLGVMFYGGLGVRADFARAAACFGRACDLGYSRGCRMLGGQYHVGVGVRRDQKSALEYYGRACDGSDQEGCNAYRALLLRLQRHP